MEDRWLLEWIRCVKKGADDAVCRGRLIPVGDGLECESCRARYPVVRGVPVLRDAPRAQSVDWFEGHYAGRSRTHELTTDYLRQERAFMAGFLKRSNVSGPCLEIGCGTGLFAETAPGYIGLEYAIEPLMASGFEAADRICGDAQRLPLADASMECVFSFNTLEHVPEVDLAFGEIDRVLKPGGLLVLKPAWHCTRYTTELIPVRSYGELSARQKLVKALLPVIRSRPYKLLTWIPGRVYRRLTRRPDNPLKWRRLTPYYGKEWISDADAAAGIDCHESIIYYTSRGYTCDSHSSALRQLLAGHDVVILRKGGRSSIPVAEEERVPLDAARRHAEALREAGPAATPVALEPAPASGLPADRLPAASRSR